MPRFKIGDRVQAEHSVFGVMIGTVTALLKGEPAILLIRNDEDENIYSIQEEKSSHLEHSAFPDNQISA